jgi:hypothetical protein
MESVQKKNSVLVSTDDVSYIVYEKLHKLNSQFENALNLQLLPRMQYLAFGIIVYNSVTELRLEILLKRVFARSRDAFDNENARV